MRALIETRREKGKKEVLTKEKVDEPCDLTGARSDKSERNKEGKVHNKRKDGGGRGRGVSGKRN